MPSVPPPTLAAAFKLDRRVTIAAQSETESTQLRVSELARQDCCVVLLAEPGMGKSTVLEQRAFAAGTMSMPVRTFLNEVTAVVTDRSTPLFLDGLDEYRADGSAADKLALLASRLRQVAPAPWWLACRAEDWTRRDFEALKGAAGAREIVVARLAPLDISESWEVLSALGDPSPNALVERAKALGGAAFLTNPLSLKLLLRSVNANGQIPLTRYALYEGATRDLAAEHNPSYEGTVRASLVEVLSTARRICALLLVANRTTVWRSTLAAPHAVGEYLTMDEIGLPSGVVGDTLDTALFSSADSGKFEPMHRTVAEFLAGWAMAEAVAGGPGRPRFPLGRALSLITGSDGPTPAPLRGVYAWMAVHLSRMGHDYAAEQMCRRDPSTVLIYGDVRVLTTSLRRTLLSSLDRVDPWFRDIGEREPAIVDAAIGGLAGEDIADDLEHVLRQANNLSDLFATVTDAIAHGDKVPRLRPVLRDIVMDERRRQYERVRAAGAWVLASPDASLAATELFRAVRLLPLSESNVVLGVSIANRFAEELSLDDAELLQLLKDHVALSERNILGRIVRLSLKLRASPRPALMLPSVNATFLYARNAAATEVWALLDNNAVGLLRSTSPPSPSEVWAWLNTRHQFPLERVEGVLRDALRYWAKDHDREAALFLHIQHGDGSGSNDWYPGRVFDAKLGRYPSAAMVAALLTPNGPFQSVKLDRRIGLATALALPANCVEDVRAGIARLPAGDRKRGEKQLAGYLAEEAARQAAARESAETPAVYISIVRDKLSAPLQSADPAEGKAMLDLAAEYHFRGYADDSCPESKLTLAEFVGKDVAGNIVAGWQVSARTAASLAPADVARAGCSRAVLAGIESLIAGSEDLPLSTALLVMCGEVWAHRADGARLELLAWAWRTLGAGGSRGAQVLLEYWETEAQCRGRLSGLPYHGLSPAAVGVVSETLQCLLCRQSCLSASLLRQVLDEAARIVPLPAMQQIARRSLARDVPQSEKHALWVCVSFAAGPEEHLSLLQKTFEQPNAPKLESVYAIIEAFASRLPPALQAIAAAAVFRLAEGEKEEAPVSDVDLGSVPVFDPASESLEWLGKLQDGGARQQLLEIESDPRFASRRLQVRNMLARQAREFADRLFVAATPQRMTAALAGGAPVNASDVRAIVVDELERIQHEMQRDPLMPWQLFWSDDADAVPSLPKIENKCRNVIGLLLQARLGHYGIVHRPVPEAQRAAETRVDLVCESVEGAALPIEMKRQQHKDLWIAAAEQLQGYTADPAAGGLGIYLVFWFGPTYSLPAHPTRITKPAPMSAEELRGFLLEDLPEPLRKTTDIFVLDVSDPRAAKPEKKPSKPRSKKGPVAKKPAAKKSPRSAPAS